MIYDQTYQRKFILPIALFYPSDGRDFFNELPVLRHRQLSSDGWLGVQNIAFDSQKILAFRKNMKRQSKPTIGPVEFIDRVIKRDEKGEPVHPCTAPRNGAQA